VWSRCWMRCLEPFALENRPHVSRETNLTCGAWVRSGGA
jgi:hypothetical protein